MRAAVDKIAGSKSDDSESSPGVLLSSGYIAGGSIAGMIFAFMSFSPEFLAKLNLSGSLPTKWNDSPWPALAAFGLLMLVLAMAGLRILFGTAKTDRRPRS